MKCIKKTLKNFLKKYKDDGLLSRVTSGYVDGIRTIDKQEALEVLGRENFLSIYKFMEGLAKAKANSSKANNVMTKKAMEYTNIKPTQFLEGYLQAIKDKAAVTAYGK